MTHVRRTAQAAVGIALVVLGIGTLDHSSRLAAYTLKGPKWSVSQVTFYVNPTNRDMTAAAAEAAARYAATNWSAQTTARVMFYYMGRTTDTSAVYNKKNIVVFRNSTNGASAAPPTRGRALASTWMPTSSSGMPSTYSSPTASHAAGIECTCRTRSRTSSATRSAWATVRSSGRQCIRR